MGCIEVVFEGEKLVPIVADIERVIAKYPDKDSVLAALIMTTILVSKPDISDTGLYNTVRELSQFLYLTLSPVEDN